jgi:hypothetical protein
MIVDPSFDDMIPSSTFNHFWVTFSDKYVIIAADQMEVMFEHNPHSVLTALFW